MRFNITQPISHQSKMLISFATKNWRHDFHEAQEDNDERFNRAEAFDGRGIPRVAKRRPNPRN
jgi:hypothetical protein